METSLLQVECFYTGPFHPAFTIALLGWGARHAVRWSTWTLLLTVPVLAWEMVPNFVGLLWWGSHDLLGAVGLHRWIILAMVGAAWSLWTGIWLPPVDARWRVWSSAAVLWAFGFRLTIIVAEPFLGHY